MFIVSFEGKWKLMKAAISFILLSSASLFAGNKLKDLFIKSPSSSQTKTQEEKPLAQKKQEPAPKQKLLTHREPVFSPEKEEFDEEIAYLKADEEDDRVAEQIQDQNFQTDQEETYISKRRQRQAEQNQEQSTLAQQDVNQFYCQEGTCSLQNNCTFQECCDSFFVWEDGPDGPFIKGEYLFWKVWQDGLDIAGKGELFPGNVKHFRYQWENGFRVGAGWYFCEDWTIEADYTWLRPRHHTTVKHNEIFPTSLPQFVSGGFKIDLHSDVFNTATAESKFNFVRSHIRFDYNVLDLEVRRNISYGACFDFDVIAGLQGALLQQKFFSDFEGHLLIQGEQGITTIHDHLPFEINSFQKWKFSGGGIKVGGAGTYNHCCGFLAYGSGRFNILFGKYQNRFDQDVEDIGRHTSVPEFRSLFKKYYHAAGKENYCDFIANFAFDLGVGYEFLGDCFGFRLLAGWEMTYWMDLAQFRTGLSSKAAQTSLQELNFDFQFSNTNLSQKISRHVGLQGLVVTAEFIF